MSRSKVIRKHAATQISFQLPDSVSEVLRVSSLDQVIVYDRAESQSESEEYPEPIEEINDFSDSFTFTTLL